MGMVDPQPADTMTVTVRDRASEAPWGSGRCTPVLRTITIPAFCPDCGGRRGSPRGVNQCDDGEWYWVQIWENPCGHVDLYSRVIQEAADLTLCDLAKRSPATSID